MCGVSRRFAQGAPAGGTPGCPALCVTKCRCVFATNIDFLDFFLDIVVPFANFSQDIPLSEFPHEMDQLKQFLRGLNSPIVLTHNDIQAGNIMWDGTEVCIRVACM